MYPMNNQTALLLRFKKRYDFFPPKNKSICLQYQKLTSNGLSSPDHSLCCFIFMTKDHALLSSHRTLILVVDFITPLLIFMPRWQLAFLCLDLSGACAYFEYYLTKVAQLPLCLEYLWGGTYAGLCEACAYEIRLSRTLSLVDINMIVLIYSQYFPSAFMTTISFERIQRDFTYALCHNKYPPL